MPASGFSDHDFIRVFSALQSPTKVARHFGITERAVYLRRNAIEARQGVALNTGGQHAQRVPLTDGAVYRLPVDNGAILICSDVHVWPGEWTTMQRAFIAFCERFNKKGVLQAVIVNGDVFDGASISRHPTIGWESKPSVKQELEAVDAWLGAVVKASGKARRIWPAGNHDGRFETRIANVAPEYRGVNGVHLKDHFQEWTPCWRVDINDDIVVKHRFQGGIHAPYNNVVKKGKTTITGHLHNGHMRPYRDLRGKRFGVDCGYMGDSPLDPQFVHYLEADEPNWEPSFVVLTFRDGRLMTPEHIWKWDDEHVEFRGDLVRV